MKQDGAKRQAPPRKRDVNMKQIALFPQIDQGATKKYTTSVGSPVYVPKERKPHILELCSPQTTTRLIAAIGASSVDDAEKRFLVMAAQRHLVFHYETIADYYAHATPEMQRLMEDSALVIPDFEQAIESGYVTLCDDIRKQYLEEQAGNDE